MTNIELGFTELLSQYQQSEGLDGFEVGRVILEHKDRYIIKTPTQEFDAELMGNLRFMAESKYDLPAVGDWVAFSEFDEGKALIHEVYPRSSIIERQAVGKVGQIQIIAANIDFGLIVQSVNRDFNLNRLERYLTICHASKVEPVIVLSKIDLIDEDTLLTIKNQINERINDVAVVTVSSQTKGYDELNTFLKKGKTYCLLGSSGVGKSTLINHISGKSVMKTGNISSAVNKGKHVTTHRELIVLDKGILIDNPGMREIGITDASGGLEVTFETILSYAENCKYSDCTHVHEKGCAVLEALDNGEIDEGAYANFRKMEKEKEHFESDTLERKKKDKNLGKLIKSAVKQRKNQKF
ncbi:ribosome small subunit-dependent GTPase A [Flammeovirga kamogawensis]|uniref:Small ribosomal subunit biogenesis GTPase RsgA n=1 Tax=Flammeovirga kamogawensis TaxID=373891 RepID=A0ABX8GZ47_9BACT|nr:ribosome small subunit-dependent GTPase A [Flammeovirga kamogawensis]MBB6459331.1 ribosome biogenesis GTPase [Flammeovirga kamogawensis]QWG08890.1 ribosome small subunit-dependent GTPase A [Flammeovirga kamogawensis]TRX67180.1 ribosome small subunit-dependent GTPase A [Flammeovirga kamogawensis]